MSVISSPGSANVSTWEPLGSRSKTPTPTCPSGDVHERDLAGDGIVSDDAVLEIVQTANVGIAQRPQDGIQLFVDELVPAGGKRRAAGSEPFERADRQPAADRIQARANRVEILPDRGQLEGRVRAVGIWVVLVHLARPFQTIGGLARFSYRAEPVQSAV